MLILFLLAAIVIWVLVMKHCAQRDREATKKFYGGDLP